MKKYIIFGLLGLAASTQSCLGGIEEDELLFSAAKDGDIGRAATALVRGANVHATDAYGNTPLHTALLFNPWDKMIRLLIWKGADPHAQNNRGESANSLADQNMNLKIDTYLEEREERLRTGKETE